MKKNHDTNYKIKLREYINNDIVYKKFKKLSKKQLQKENFSDFEMFCILHCMSIESLLGECDALWKTLDEIERKIK